RAATPVAVSVRAGARPTVLATAPIALRAETTAPPRRLAIATAPANPTTTAPHAELRTSPRRVVIVRVAATTAVTTAHSASRPPRVADGRSRTSPAVAIPRAAQLSARSSPDGRATFVPMAPGSRRRRRTFRDERHGSLPLPRGAARRDLCPP